VNRLVWRPVFLNEFIIAVNSVFACNKISVISEGQHIDDDTVCAGSDCKPLHFKPSRMFVMQNECMHTLPG